MGMGAEEAEEEEEEEAEAAAALLGLGWPALGFTKKNRVTTYLGRRVEGGVREGPRR